jgi:muramoyltetrapeptide carboxypeptidase
MLEASFYSRESLRRPPRLDRGDHIAVVAPAGVVDPEQLSIGVAVIQEMGWVPVTWEGVLDRYEGFAGEDRQRARRFQDAWATADIQGIFCARGGYGCMRILPYLDFDAFRKNPKIMLGFSDITALHAALYRQSGVVSFHGPLVATLPETSSEARQWLQNVLMGHPSLPPMMLDTQKVIRHGRALGPLFVGNLATLCHLIGTPFMPDLRGHLLVIEDIAESWHRIDRMLIHLRLAGALRGVCGLLLGSFRDCGSYPERICRVAAELGSELDIPIVYDLPVGHIAENRTLPIGIMAECNTETGVLRLIEHATVP